MWFTSARMICSPRWASQAALLARSTSPHWRKSSRRKKVGKVPGVGGDRDLARQVECIRKGMRFITTNSEIAFILAEGSRVTGELRTALA